MNNTKDLSQQLARQTGELAAAHAELERTNSELLQLTLEMEDRVAERTAELTAVNESLRASEERFRIATETANDVVYEWALQQRIEWIGNIDSLLGYAEGEFPRTLDDWVAALHPDDRERVTAAVAAHLEGRSRYEVEYRIRKTNGDYKWWSARGAVTRDAEGKPVRMIGTITDITERKQAEEVQVFLAQTSSGTAAEPFFNALARYLAGSLHMDFVCIDRLEGDGLNARTLAVWCDGKFEDNVTYALKDTPCGDIVGRSVCCFPANVCQFFPRDTVLTDLRAESYVGVTLWNHTGQPIGLIAVIGRSPLADRAMAEATLKLVAVRAAGELERQETEVALRASEQKLRQIIEHSAQLFYAHTPDNVLTYVSPRTREFFDLDAADALRPWTDFLTDHPVNAEGMGLTQRALATGERQRPYELELRSMQGRKLWVEVYESPVVVAGKAVAMVGALTDITERKQAAEALHATEAEFRSLAEAMPQMVWITRPDGWNIYFSQQWMDYTGLTLEESLGHGWNKPFHPDDQQRAWDAWQQATATLGTYSLECRLRRADGIYRWWLIRGLPVRDADGSVRKWFGTCTDIHETKLAEEQLRETNSYLENLFNYANAPIIVWDPQFRITRFNHAFESLTGRSAAEVIGQSLELLFPPALVENSMALIKKTTGGERWETVEIPILHLDGSIRTVLWNSATILAGDGKTPVATIAQGHDITERKRAEATLDASEVRYRRLFEATRDGILILDAKTGRVVNVNPFLIDLLGYSHAAFLGKKIWELGFFKDIIANQDNFAELQQKEYLRYEDKPLETADGRRIEVEFTSNVYLVNDEKVIQCNIRDISERKAAEEKKRASEIRYRRLFESAKDGILILDAETGMVVDVNPFLVQLLGFSHEEFLGKKVWELGFFKDIIANQDNFAELQQKEYLRYENLALETGDGRRIEVEFISNVYLVNRQKVIQCSIRDISERKQAEEKIKRTLADLERSNQELEHFAYVASHDLQEPLRMVASYTQLLAHHYEKQLDDKARKYINYAVDGSVRMQTLINDLLTYSRAGRRGKPLGPTDTHAVLGEAIRNLAVAIEENHAIITNEELPTVWADAAQLVLLFQNLLGNAIKFRRADLAHIHVSARQQGESWLFAVKDNGIGIEAQYAERVFIIFQRLHTREEYPGTGIGLAICKRIVERHGGRIWFESQPGIGTTFYFTIPINQPTQTTDISKAHENR